MLDGLGPSLGSISINCNDMLSTIDTDHIVGVNVSLILQIMNMTCGI